MDCLQIIKDKYVVAFNKFIAAELGSSDEAWYNTQAATLHDLLEALGLSHREIFRLVSTTAEEG